MQPQIGIVLKSYFPYKKKITLLDQEKGKIDAVPTIALSAGTWCHYWYAHKSHIYLLRDVRMHDMPLLVARQDILFLHHALEWCFYTLAYESPSPDLFALLTYLYQTDRTEYSQEEKIAFLFKLFVLSGIYPSSSSESFVYFYHLAQSSIDTLIDKIIDLELKRSLYDWIVRCMMEHPLVHSFKTTHFLKTIGMP